MSCARLYRVHSFALVWIEISTRATYFALSPPFAIAHGYLVISKFPLCRCCDSFVLSPYPQLKCSGYELHQKWLSTHLLSVCRSSPCKTPPKQGQLAFHPVQSPLYFIWMQDTWCYIEAIDICWKFGILGAVWGPVRTLHPLAAFRVAGWNIAYYKIEMGPIGDLANLWWKLFTPDKQQLLSVLFRLDIKSLLLHQSCGVNYQAL